MRGVQELANRMPGLSLVVCMLFLCWPAFVNGGAFFFPDTSAYLRGADAVVHQVTGWRSEWSDKLHFYVELAPDAPAQGDGQAEREADADGAGPLHPVLLGRSVYYGLTIFPFIALFGSLGGALLQAALAVFVIRITLISLGVDRSRLPVWLLGASALLAGLTSLPFVVSMLMPDVFAGFAIALAVSAVIGWERLSTLERAGLVVVLALSAMVHSSHALNLFILLVIALLVRLALRAGSKTGLAVVLLAALCGVAGERLFIGAVTDRLGEAPIRPPFLTARLIDEGPGLAMLADRCPAAGFEACHFLERMPRDSDTFLWSLDRREGVFSVESHAVQRRLAGQDFAVALATLRHDPVAVIWASAEAGFRQLLLTDLDMFNAPATDGERFEGNLPHAYADEVRSSRYGMGSMPVAFWEWTTVLTTIAASVFLAATVLGRGYASRFDRKAAVAAGLFLAAVATNAAVTGALSKPHDRYNVRVIWVLPLAALALLAAGSGRKPRERDSADT